MGNLHFRTSIINVLILQLACILCLENYYKLFIQEYLLFMTIYQNFHLSHLIKFIQKRFSPLHKQSFTLPGVDYSASTKTQVVVWCL